MNPPELNDEEDIRQSYYKLYMTYFTLNNILQREMELRQKSIEALTDEFTTQNQSEKALNDNLNALIDGNLNRAHRLLEKLNKKSQELLEIKANLRVANLKIEEQEDEIQILKLKLDDNENSNKEIKKEKDKNVSIQYKTQINELQKQIDQMNQQLQYKDSRIEQLNEELKTKSAFIESIENDNKEKKIQMEKISLELKETHNQLVIHQKSMNDFLNISQESPWGFTEPFKKKISELQAEVLNMKSEIQTKNENLEETKERLESSQIELIKTKQDLERLKEDLENTKQELDKAKEEAILSKNQIIPSSSSNQQKGAIIDAQRLNLLNSQLISFKNDLERREDERYDEIQNNFDTVLDEIRLMNKSQEIEIQPKKGKYSIYKIFKLSFYVLILCVCIVKL